MEHCGALGPTIRFIPKGKKILIFKALVISGMSPDPPRDQLSPWHRSCRFLDDEDAVRTLILSGLNPASSPETAEEVKYA